MHKRLTIWGERVLFSRDLHGSSFLLICPTSQKSFVEIVELDDNQPANEQFHRDTEARSPI
jgi:hypothetical protein